MTDPLKFWSLVKQMKVYSRAPGILRDYHETLNKLQDIVNAFVQHFSSVYNSPFQFGNVEDDVSLLIVNITEDDIIRASKKLSNKLTAGLDGVSSFIVKDSIGVLAAPLVHIFNISASAGIYPSVWKKSVHQFIKRLINPLSQITDRFPSCQIFRRFMRSSFTATFSKLSAIECHGFMPKRSTTSNLVSFFEKVLKSMDQSDQIKVIYTDF